MPKPKLIDLNGLSTFYSHVKALINAKYTKPSGGIPATDFSANAQMMLGNSYVPSAYGAAMDGSTDDTSALLSCAAACVSDGKQLYIPSGKRVKLTEKVVLDNVKSIRIDGTIIAPNGLDVRARSSQDGYDWTFSRVTGELTLSGLKDSIIRVLSASSLRLVADSTIQYQDSIGYNTFFLGYVPSVSLVGVGSGWINENAFYGGRISTLLVTGNYSHSGNHFFHNAFESANIEFTTGHDNYIHYARLEGTNTIVMRAAATGNYIQRAGLNHFHAGYIEPNWTDESGRNFFTAGDLPAMRTYTTALTAQSRNYDTGKAWPLNGKLHCKSSSTGLWVSNIMPVDKPLTVKITSDAQFFRVWVICYDANGQRLSTQPQQQPFYPANMTWTTYNSYNSGSANISSWKYVISRYTHSGIDTGVCYAQISIQGYSAADIDALRICITAKRSDIEPFLPERLTGNVKPTAGDWNDGDVVWCTSASASALAWVYHNSAWRDITYSQ